MKEEYFIEDFFELANNMNINFDILEEYESKEVFKEMIVAFFPSIHYEYYSKSDTPLWEFLTVNYTGVSLPMAASQRAKFLDVIPNIENVKFCFEPNSFKHVIAFENYKGLKSILKNSYNFDFYIFSIDDNFLICWHSFETLFGCCEAVNLVNLIGAEW